MLVLSRKKDEAIVINDDITIVVVEIRGDKVRLGVEAPKEVPVHRREVFDAIREDSRGSSIESIQGDLRQADLSTEGVVASPADAGETVPHVDEQAAD